MERYNPFVHSFNMERKYCYKFIFENDISMLMIASASVPTTDPQPTSTKQAKASNQHSASTKYAEIAP